MKSNFTKYLIDVYFDAQNDSDYLRSIICIKSQIIWTDCQIQLMLKQKVCVYFQLYRVHLSMS